MKKVLIITYFWPPAGGPGVQRVLKFAKYLPQFGWQPVILTVKDGEFPAIDNSLLSEIPDDIKVYKTKSLEPFALYKKFTGKKKEDKIPTYVLNKSENDTIRDKISKWIRNNIFIPDAKIGWKPAAIKSGLKIIEQENIDLIFASSPPHSVQLIAKKLAQKSKLKWVADFRDPWMEIVYYQGIKRSLITRFIDAKLEKSVFRFADSVISINQNLLDLFNKKVPLSNSVLIPNGYDEQDFTNIIQKDPAVFTITYAGVLSKERIPYALIAVLKNFMAQKRKFNFVIIGKVCQEFSEEIEKNGLTGNTQFVNYIPHKEVLKYLLNSSVLLLVIDDVPQNKGFSTGKIFDYLFCKKPILALGPVDGEAAKMILETDSGKMHDYHDSEGVEQTLNTYYASWSSPQMHHAFKIENYNRKSLTKKLAQALDQL